MRSNQSQFLFDIINLTLTSLMGYSFYLVIRLACDRMDIGWDKISLPVAIFAVVLSSTLCVYIKHFWSRKKREYLLCFFEANGYSGMRSDTVICIKSGEYTVALALLLICAIHIATSGFFVSLLWDGIFACSRIIQSRTFSYIISCLLYLLSYYTYLALSRRRFYYSLIE